MPSHICARCRTGRSNVRRIKLPIMTTIGGRQVWTGKTVARVLCTVCLRKPALKLARQKRREPVDPALKSA